MGAFSFEVLAADSSNDLDQQHASGPDCPRTSRTFHLIAWPGSWSSIAVLGRVDLYVAHQVDPGTPWAESLPVFSRAVENGTIRAYGLSNVDGEALAFALETADRLGLVRPELIQNQYSLLARGDDQDVESQWQGIHEALTLRWTDALGELLDKVFGR